MCAYQNLTLEIQVNCYFYHGKAVNSFLKCDKLIVFTLNGPTKFSKTGIFIS